MLIIRLILARFPGIGLDEKITTLKTQWELEKNTISGEAGIKEQIDNVKNQIAEAERNTDLQLAAELKYGKLMELEKKLEAVQGKEKSENQLLKEEIDGNDIANIVSKWTGIPVTKLMEGEREKIIENTRKAHFNADDGLFTMTAGKSVYTEIANSLAVINKILDSFFICNLCNKSSCNKFFINFHLYPSF